MSDSKSNVLALKYRPKNFKELLGQESVSRTLRYSLENNNLANAYLFSGLRGSGKTSSARIFSKTILCQKMPIADPCEECDSCKMANNNNHPDIIEMDGASNRGIDDIRNLISQTQYTPISGKYKIFIIDEVHMLTKEAFNALLKTLEEPPAHIKFILATTDPLKLPATILSRTQHFNFKRVENKLVIEHLKHILQIEHINYDQDSINRIVKRGEGSLRDTLTTLQQAIAYCGNKLEISKVVEMLGAVEPIKLNDLINKITSSDRAGIINMIPSFAKYETDRIFDELIDVIKEKMFEQKLDLNIIERFFSALNSGKMLLNSGANSEFVLSLTLLKMITPNENERFEKVVYIEKEVIKKPQLELKIEPEFKIEKTSDEIFKTEVLEEIRNKNPPTNKISDDFLINCLKNHYLYLQYAADIAEITIDVCFENDFNGKCAKAIKNRLTLIEGVLTGQFNNGLKPFIKYNTECVKHNKTINIQVIKKIDNKIIDPIQANIDLISQELEEINYFNNTNDIAINNQLDSINDFESLQEILLEIFPHGEII